MPGPDPVESAGASSYAHADLVVLRAALAPRTPVRRPGTDTREAEDPERLRELCTIFRNDPALAAALELASPDLAQALIRPFPETARRARDRRRMTIALTGYLLRLRHRATPFGLFAGTAPITLGAGARGGIGTRHRLLLRPTPGWLAGLVAALESDPGLPDRAPRVRIATAPTLRRAGGFHVLADRTAGGPGRWEAHKYVSHSRLTDAVLAMAAEDRVGNRGIRYSALLDLLCAAAPAIGREQLARYVSGLLTAQFLATDLLPAPGDADPLRCLIDRLDGHPLAERLDGVRRDLRRPPPSLEADDIRRLRGRLRAVHQRGAGLVADTLLDTDLRLPRRVADEVEHAASVAWTCTPSRPDRPLDGMHQAMLSRYGVDRPVPLAELLDLTESLGLRGSLPPTPGPAASFAVRDRLLSGLALDALTAGRAELRLDRPVRRRLADVSGASGFPPSVDVFAEIVTRSAEALDRGDFLVVLGSQGTPGPAGSAVGRLASSVGAEAAGRSPRRVRPEDAGPLDVEVVFRPTDAAAANLVSETGWTAFRIDLTPHPPRRSDRDIALEDLYVICGLERLRLYSERLERDIRPVSYSTLDPRHAGAIAGLLLALGRDGATPWKSWDWGAARTLPWLPRVRVGRAVLAPARWILPPDLLHLAKVGTDRQWRRGLQRWRDTDELPDVVFAGAGDRRLPLDLADPVHAAMLRRECRDRGVVIVTEPPGGVAAWRGVGWPLGPGGPHTAEIAVPLHPRRAPSRGDPISPPDPLAPDSVFLPGGPWLCVNLTVLAALQDSVLAELADEALKTAAEQADVDRWFFVRTADPAGVPQLVLRFHGPPQGLNQTFLPALRTWGGRLRSAGLIREFALLSYWPELWRYGGGSRMEAAERVFHRDSRLCLQTLASMRGPARVEQVAAPGVLHILAVMLGSRRAVGELPQPRLSAAERRLFTRLRPLLRKYPAEEHDRPPVVVSSHGRGARSAWQDWHAALAAYRSGLIGAADDPAPIAWSLVHMHCNRLAGPNRPVERIAVALARDLAMALSRDAVTGRSG